MEVINFLIFLALSGVIILSALAVLFSPKIVYSVIGAVVCFLGVAGIFLQLNADFVGISQIVIYGVGISILFIFAIMLTSQEEEKNLWIALKPRLFVALLSVGLLFTLIVFCITGGGKKFDNAGVFNIVDVEKSHIEFLKKEGTTNLIGQRLFTDYVLPFEILSLLLLAGIVGAGVLAGKDDELDREEK